MDIFLVLSVCAVGITCGYIALIPGVMSFDAGDKTKPSMALLGVSSLSIIPITVAATTLTILSANPLFMGLHALPISGIGVAFATDPYFQKQS